ncbi:adhesin [Leptospira adleri]|uniref:Adhesin n=2 Tax=Leptospira adleri TaxID=2023186 RepID=A0ABX4NTG5_9LEPT|nr:adhesin [Leptospira adleri]
MNHFFKSLKFYSICFAVFVLAVGQTVTTVRFKNMKDGTVLDYRTGFLWQVCPAGLGSENASHQSTCGADNGNMNGTPTVYTWANALKYCNGLLSEKPPVLPAGKTWRLPNINELKSIVDRSQMNPAMDTSVLTTAGVDYFWSSTSVASGSSAAWTVNFFYGTSYGTSDKDFGYYVRCVATN